MFATFLLIAVACFTLYVVRGLRKTGAIATIRGAFTPGLRPVPIVDGALPLVGHGLAFSRDIIGFVSACQARYGPVFQIRLFRLNVVIICDRALAPEFFKAPEDRLSLYAVLDRLYFGHGFSNGPPDHFIPRFVAVVKKSIAVKYDLFVPKIRSEAGRMVDRLRAKCEGAGVGGLEIDLTEEMMRFVSNTSAQCFIGVGLPEPVFHTVLQFTLLLNHIIVLTSYVPTWLIRALVGWRVASLRQKIIACLEPEIETYRTDPHKVESLVLRTAVDYREGDEEQGRELSNVEIGELLVCLLYVSTENTALGLSNTLLDLVLHQAHGWWQELATTCSRYLAAGDIRGLLEDPLLNACIMESARLNTHIFPVSRQPSPADNWTLGDYFLDPHFHGHFDNVVFCPPLLQVHGPDAGHIFHDPHEYNPRRFIESKESFKSVNIMTWGSGLHLCPGKVFALYEIKMAVALLVIGFKVHMSYDKNECMPEKDYFSPSAFAERKVKLVVEARG